MESQEPDKEVRVDVAHIDVRREFMDVKGSADRFCFEGFRIEVVSFISTLFLNGKNLSQRCLLFAARRTSSEVCRFSFDVGQVECCKVHIHAGLYLVLLVLLNFYSHSHIQQHGGFKNPLIIK